MKKRGFSLLANVLVFGALLLSSQLDHAQQSRSAMAVDELGAISDGLEAVTAQTMQCVVKITGDTYLPEQDYYDERVRESNNPANASEVEGSGILVSSDGYIVTNAHVVSGEHRLRVFLHTPGMESEENPQRSLALIQPPIWQYCAFREQISHSSN